MSSQSTCSLASYDSDATVAPEPEEEEVDTDLEELPRKENGEDRMEEENCEPEDCDNSSAISPSILHPNNDPGKNKILDVVPCSSDSEGAEEILSQEYPPLKSDASEHGETGVVAHATQQPSTLNQIVKDQAVLISEIERILGNYGGIFPANFIKNARDTMSGIEGQLKLVSEAHQLEKKDLVMLHTRLSQRHSQEGGGAVGETGSLKSRLVSLSARQKQLLQCFMKQKEISRQLAKLVEREISTKRTVEFSRKDKSCSDENATVVMVPNLSKHLLGPQLHPYPLSLPQPPTDSAGAKIPLASSLSGQCEQLKIGQTRSNEEVVLHDPSRTTPATGGRGLLSTNSQPVQRTSAPANVCPQDTTVQSSSRSGRAPQQGGDLEKALASGRAPQQGGDLEKALGSGRAPQSDDLANAKTVTSLSSSELTQPVPLKALIQHNILQAGPGTLTCTILGCGFTGSLLQDGTIQEIHTPGSPGSGGKESLHQLPQQWVRACWTRLGHCHKKIVKKQAYNGVFYRGKTLSHYCEQYSRKQISSYLSHKKSSHSTQPVNSVELNNKNAQSPSAAIREFVGTAVQRQHCPMDCSTAIQPTLATHLPMDSSAPTPAPIPTDNVFNLDSLLAVGEVLLVSGNYKSLQLPSYFWAPECKVFPPDIQQQIETDFDW